MNRIDLKFKVLKEQNKKAMIAFITAGDPDMETTAQLVYAMEKSGADIIELGIPYSDPLADGPVIQASSLRALGNGIKIKDIMAGVTVMRKESNVPLIFLVYYNAIFKYGVDRFIRDAHIAGIDGLIIPDLPIEEREEITKTGDKYHVCLIPLVAPTSKERIEKIVRNGKGFVYCVSAPGVTGVRQDIGTDMEAYMNEVAGYTALPKAIGFGISGPDMAERFKPFCEGIIVGSAIVKTIGEAGTKKEMIENVSKIVSDIKAVL